MNEFYVVIPLSILIFINFFILRKRIKKYLETKQLKQLKEKIQELEKCKK